MNVFKLRTRGRKVITLPSDCGNALRMGIVSDFVADWAKGVLERLGQIFKEAAVWTIAGGGGVSAEAAAPAQNVLPGGTVDVSELYAIATYGRIAACDGF